VQPAPRTILNAAAALLLLIAVSGCSVLSVISASSCDPDKDDCPSGERCGQAANGNYYCFSDATVQESSGPSKGEYELKSVRVHVGTDGVGADVNVEKKGE
jgi:hypothetical protein